MVALNFNAQQVAPNTALEPIPTGQYPVIITRSEEKPTKAGDGSYIEIEMTIQGHSDPKLNGRKVFDRLNIRNKNQQAVDIAYSTLSAICHVTGCLHIQDTAQLHGRPFTAVVIKKPREDQPGNMTNEVKGYKDINGNDPGFAGAVAQPAAQPGWAQPPAPQPQGQQYANPNPGAPMPPAAPPAWAGNAGTGGPAPASAPALANPPAPASVNPPAGPAAGTAPPPWATGAAA